MAGGTGGHIFPALATARELKSRGFNIHWLGTPNSMEAELVPKHGFDISFLPVTGLRGKGLGFLLKAPWRVSVSLLRAVRALRRHKPVCVLGMGGYVTGPGGLAARLLGVPLVIHEQNAIAGLTNKVLARISSRVLEAFPGTFKKAGMKTEKVFHTGNPVRADIQNAVQPLEQRGDAPVRLLVVGGSRGAQVFNQTVPEALALLSESEGVPSVQIWHQTGKGNLEATRQLYRDHGVEGRVEEFIDDMAETYDWADLILCRSGALTVSELAIAGRPSILVPYPWAVDDHQTANGHYLVEQSAALMIQQSEFNKGSLARMLQDLVANRSRLEQMGAAARSIALPESTRQVAEHCLEVVNV
ncbi:UDP-diphospho-muramoylpentapeptide beta-N- acetylglucosaminyltransferase [Endozoicomonas montiporae]|uniref:UDP-N-acetylglucosamine--N-acetylmuramyl-(pentapeptide) pyrophosphoryl-undecaprenol N-acetylglucosamine transferase n=2 Tax=Endozoicomonas montiporae TaxID=1027273 RepID=A0A081N635_9GAMM|nr:UDP-diphospho-muramoylpentapeptide beta-N- acetylglucosaminyltransferase [Endozoicomonas montiporae]